MAAGNVICSGFITRVIIQVCYITLVGHRVVELDHSIFRLADIQLVETFYIIVVNIIV